MAPGLGPPGSFVGDAVVTAGGAVKVGGLIGRIGDLASAEAAAAEAEPETAVA